MRKFSEKNFHEDGEGITRFLKKIPVCKSVIVAVYAFTSLTYRKIRGFEVGMHDALITMTEPKSEKRDIGSAEACGVIQATS